MNYRDFNLDDWIGHISGVIEDETTLDGNEMRDLVEFLTTLKQYPTTKNDLGVDAVAGFKMPKCCIDCGLYDPFYRLLCYFRRMYL